MRFGGCARAAIHEDDANRSVNSFLLAARAELRRAWPFALVLALALGAVLVVGANLSNAFPSQERPFGWPGPASFENGVAMVRDQLVLAATLPALALGATMPARRQPEGPLAADAALVALACGVAALLGAWGASTAPPDAVIAFWAAHALLALAFWALALVCAAFARKHALPLALAVWTLFVALWENGTRWILFRQVGYGPLSTGQFPSWYYVSQALSPLSAYRGVLILWRRGFMDAIERAVLGQAALPPWMTPGVFAAFLVGFWIALPAGIATLVWRVRGRAARSKAPDAEPA